MPIDDKKTASFGINPVMSINGSINIVHRTSLPMKDGTVDLYAIELPSGKILNNLLAEETEFANSGDTDFILRTRFTLVNAIKLAYRYVQK